MDTTFTPVDQIRKQYALALQNFLRAFQEDSRSKVMEMVLATADKVAVSDNWYIGTDAVLRSLIWNEIRGDLKLHATLIKFERMVLTLMAMDGLQLPFEGGIRKMIMPGSFHEIVDKDFKETCQHNEAVDVLKIPGAVGLLSVILFRDIWTIVTK